MRGLGPRTVFLAALLGSAVLAGACGGGDGPVETSVAGPFRIAVSVRSAAGSAVVGARVYLVPAGDVDTRPIDGADVRSGAAEDRDEPLEDAVRLRGGTYPQATTNAAGAAVLAGVPDGSYFCFVTPSAGDGEHLPGGTGCRQARSALTLSLDPQEVVLSSRPPPGASYLGSSICLNCHVEQALQKTHAHRLGFAVPGSFGPLQDPSRYPRFQDGWQRFLPAAAHTGGTVVWLYDRDPAPGADPYRFRTSLTMPAAGTPYVKAYLWRDTVSSRFKITLENVHPLMGAPGVMDPPNLWTLEVDLTYGGALAKQHPLVRVPNRKGRYPLLQFQTEGDDTRWDPTRRVYRDFQLEQFWNDTLKIFRYPDLDASFEANCTACHSTGFQRYQDPGTGEWLSRAVKDVAGVIDIDGDGDRDEINLGCEVCHGPGSAHGTWAGDPDNAGREARFIVGPHRLSPSRDLMICGRCHDRRPGRGSVANLEPLDTADRMAPPGISRADFLAAYVSAKGPASANLWSDELHSRDHHQQYADFLKSPKHRNDRLLVTCADCHGSHGDGAFHRHLRWDPRDARQGLCFQCHGQELTSHMLAVTGATHAGDATLCIFCHMPETAKAGAGRYGHRLAPATGTMADEATIYFENDRRSHLFRAVARKTGPDVKGVLPAFAMPIPYTLRACGVGCHVVGPLQFPKPMPSFEELRAIHAPRPGRDDPAPRQGR